MHFVLRCKLLQFTTGTTNLPVEGFAGLQSARGVSRLFQVTLVATTNTPGQPTSPLPRAHTCFNTIDLPGTTCIFCLLCHWALGGCSLPQQGGDDAYLVYGHWTWGYWLWDGRINLSVYKAQFDILCLIVLITWTWIIASPRILYKLSWIQYEFEVPRDDEMSRDYQPHNLSQHD